MLAYPFYGLSGIIPLYYIIFYHVIESKAQYHIILQSQNQFPESQSNTRENGLKHSKRHKEN